MTGVDFLICLAGMAGVWYVRGLDIADERRRHRIELEQLTRHFMNENARLRRAPSERVHPSRPYDLEIDDDLRAHGVERREW